MKKEVNLNELGLVELNINEMQAADGEFLRFLGGFATGYFYSVNTGDKGANALRNALLSGCAAQAPVLTFSAFSVLCLSGDTPR